ncbi:MAG TPA: hypothetical protein IAD07_00025 [Candidatus Fimivicinus intestinavium]|nr:hypothetical protein [Candidatus Fimivicinus intestinavium]
MLEAFLTVKTVLTRILAIFTMVLTVLTGAADALAQGEVYPYLSKENVVGLPALARSQDVTTDGESFFFSGKSSLVRVSLDNETVLARNLDAIPQELEEQFGSAHIGGISYYDGKLYAAVEDSKVWAHPLVVLYDAETLRYTGVYAELGSGRLTRGVPWVACDAQAGCFYAAQSKSAPSLLCYDLETFGYLGAIPLSEPVPEIQGAEVYQGKLYAATNDRTRAVYEIDLATGAVRKYFDRILLYSSLIANFGGEGEGITVLPMEDGSLFHTLEVGMLFLNSTFRHYAPLDQSRGWGQALFRDDSIL